MSHGNASLTPTGRLRLARCVVEDGWPLRRAAERFGVSVTTAQRWSGRYRQEGQPGMGDRSSRPRRCPGQLPARTEHRIMGLRVNRRWGPARIAYRLGLTPSTVGKVLNRYQAPRLAWTDPATGCRLRAKPKHFRYEHKNPGDLVHVDIKKIGQNPDGGGHRFLGRAGGVRVKKGAKPGPRTSTTPWMTTPGWCTPRSSPMSVRRPRQRSGPALTTTSTVAASPSCGC